MKARWMGEHIGNGFEVIEAEPGNIGCGGESVSTKERES
jgi:hypothetical protein